jgi:hypothetical protein
MVENRQLGPEEPFPKQLLADIVVKRLMGTGKAFIAAYYIICFISYLCIFLHYFSNAYLPSMRHVNTILAQLRYHVSSILAQLLRHERIMPAAF